MTTSSDLEELEEGTVFRLANITHRARGEAKSLYRALRSQIADIAFRLES